MFNMNTFVLWIKTEKGYLNMNNVGRLEFSLEPMSGKWQIHAWEIHSLQTPYLPVLVTTTKTKEEAVEYIKVVFNAATV